MKISGLVKSADSKIKRRCNYTRIPNFIPRLARSGGFLGGIGNTPEGQDGHGAKAKEGEEPHQAAVGAGGQPVPGD